jgi:hypothetical protein
MAFGYFFDRWQVEGRLVLGSPAALVFCPQLHLGARYFPFIGADTTFLRGTGFGAFLRIWDFYYTHSNIHFFNVSLQPSFGYVWYGNPVFLDLRTGWDFAVFTWSNLEHSRSKLAWTGFPPGLSLNLCHDFQ